jgi:hypothetical protein
MPAPEMSGWAMGETRERRWNLWYWLGVAFVAYLVPLIVLAIDAAFFQSRLNGSLGPEVTAVLDVIYWPLGKVGGRWMDD